MAGEDDDSSRPKSVVGSLFDFNLSFGDPIYLYPNDTSGTPIVTIKLTGIKNYKMWSIAMTFTLRNHNKLGFVDGSFKKDSSNHGLANQCNMCNSVVTYDKVDGSAMSNLHKNINSLNQTGSTLADYYNNLNSLWKRFDVMVSLHTCTCDAAKYFDKHNQLIKLMQFLMGLDECYLAIRSNLLTRELLPNVNTIFFVISGEESHMNVTSIGTTKHAATAFVAKTFDNKKRFNKNFKGSGSNSNSNSNNRGPNPNLKSTNCNKIGHTVDICFELVRYPAGYVKRNFNSNSRPVTSNNAFADVYSNVGHPNGTQALITKIRDLKINNKVTLYDVLVVPKYTVSLLSVHKLSKDSKLFVGFDENNCYIQDLKANRTAGIGKQYNGLYLFDVDNALSSDINQSNDDFGATSMDETNNTHHEGIVPNETEFINDFYKNLDSNSKTEELPVHTLRRSFRQTKLPSSLNEFIVERKVKYGVERVVNYANLNHDNYYFVAALNKSIGPTCYEEAILDSN
nr:hypothetical protein [Tanacetum cinerariifolium]